MDRTINIMDPYISRTFCMKQTIEKAHRQTQNQPNQIDNSSPEQKKR